MSQRNLNSCFPGTAPARHDSKHLFPGCLRPQRTTILTPVRRETPPKAGYTWDDAVAALNSHSLTRTGGLVLHARTGCPHGTDCSSRSQVIIWSLSCLIAIFNYLHGNNKKSIWQRKSILWTTSAFFLRCKLLLYKPFLINKGPSWESHCLSPDLISYVFSSSTDNSSP